MRDEAKRSRVRKFLKAKKWQEASDRDLARQAEVSRALVASVRRQLIAAGSHPPRDEDRPIMDRSRKLVLGYIRAYKPGAAARGGYVYDEHGQTVQVVDWLKRHRASK